jgi:hypothetical protein
MRPVVSLDIPAQTWRSQGVTIPFFWRDKPTCVHEHFETLNILALRTLAVSLRGYRKDHQRMTRTLRASTFCWIDNTCGCRFVVGLDGNAPRGNFPPKQSRRIYSPLEGARPIFIPYRNTLS